MPTPQTSGITKKEALAIIQRCKARASTSSRRAQGTHFTEFQYSVLQARFAIKPLPKAREQSALSQAIGMTPKQAEDWFKHAAKKKKKFPKTKDKAILAILRVAKKESGRMPYTLLSLKNRAVLCAWFEISDRISAQEQVELGKELGVRSLSIQYWFNSRRKKLRNGKRVEEAVYDPEEEDEEEDEDQEDQDESEDDEPDQSALDDQEDQDEGPEYQDSTDSEADHDEEDQEDRDPMEDTEDELEEREGQDPMNSEDDEDRRTDNLQEESEAQGEQDPMEDAEDDLESPEAQDQDPMEDDDLEEPEAHNPMDSEDEDAPEEPVADEDAPENPEDPDADQDAPEKPDDAPAGLEDAEDPDADQNAPEQPIPDQAPDFYNNQWHEIPEEDQDAQFGLVAPDNEDSMAEDRPDRFREGRELPRGLDEHQMAYQNDLFMDF
ncbi:hypothetical protein B9Z55_021684 [Caenorhabditis nigoni]|uniref:Homeobox domain-containing protein n=1 Tax=Caenorhabditis nigoni TaxID=1611254 RepID=A0A2G5TTZ2_9PELO|nr:hypothetical protein B9Z55_021684 [Caenorhabditis nigoni]